VVLSRSKLETLKTILTSEYWLIASLCGAFFSFFALNRGGVVLFIDACAVFLFINIITGSYPLKSIPKSHLITIAICAYLLGTSILFNFKASHYRWMAFMVRMLCVVFAIHCLSRKGIKDWVASLFFIILSSAVCWQAFSYHILQMPWGTFSNPHLLSSFSMAALPAIIYALIVTRGWYRFCYLPVALLDIDLLLRIKSRPAVLGVAVGAVFVFIFMVKGWRKWGSLLLVGCTLVVLYVTDYGNVYSRFEELIVNFSQEERLPLWTSAWNMLKDNTLTAWIFGNGIGGGRSVIPEYIPDPRLKTLIFSHNYLLEICYENGIVGVILVFGGVASLLFLAIKTAKQKNNKNIRILISCMVVAFISWLIHAGLTLPFYSKYSQYSLAFILGTLLASLEQPSNKNRPAFRR
jgi:O-antigen ligase